jgi:hypothetical protein
MRRSCRACGAPTTLSVALAAVALALLAGCAPHVGPAPPRLEGEVMQARFLARLEERRTRVAVAEGDYSVWARRAGAADAPGVSVRVRLTEPDAFRLRVDALFGTAIAAAAHRDTLVLDAPVVGVAAVSNAGADRSARQDVGAWVLRALAATWAPPAGAWAAGAAADSAWSMGWVESGDSLELAVGTSGLPRAARIRAPGGVGVEIRYERWATWDGVLWPARIVAGDDGGRLSLTLQPSNLSLKPRADGVATLRLPRGARHVDRAELLRWLERLAIAAGADSSEAGGP